MERQKMRTQADKEDLDIRVISSSNEIAQMESDWNALVKTSCDNPFLLSEFARQIANSKLSTGWAPLVLIMSARGNIVGISPFMTKMKFGVRFVKFVYRSTLSPDFITFDQHREACIARTLEFLFKTLKCKFADFSLPVESPNFRILKQQCKANKIQLWTTCEMGHRILPVNCTWNEFESMKRKNFRSQYKKIRRKLDKAGSWKITCSTADEGNYAVKKILDVEEKSWKEAWRTKQGKKTDAALMTIIKAMQQTAAIEPTFKWNVWFLELNQHKLAYLLVLQYKEVAFLTKTSYDKKYSEFYPGSYLRHAVIRDLFNGGRVKSIDFLTDLPHQRTWTPVCLPRVKVRLAKGVLPTILKSTFVNDFLTKSGPRLYGRLPFHLSP